MKRRLKHLGMTAALLAASTAPSAAYYHYVHYLSSSAPYQVMYEKFDLTALPDKTVTFFVSDNGPTSYTPNDSFPSVLGQIRNATQVWNAVASSDLRVAFGGLQMAGTVQSVPTGEVVFEELPPGLLAFAGPAVTAAPETAPDGTLFVPIVESLIHLNINLTQQPGPAYSDSFEGPSYSEAFFMTLVHEVGHAVGLQHTFTSASMSTAVSRATNRARPLDADDIASISLLYPRNGFPAGYGSISGQVTMGGTGVHMASVVALLPNGSAVSNLTNPDGTYQIDGLPPGAYFVYVHPLPPTANIQFPLDPAGNPVQPGGPFVSTFYPGTWDPGQFTPVKVAQGASVGGINFSVNPRQSVEVYDVTSYWYSSIYNQPAYLNAGTEVQTLVAQGNGLFSGTNSTPVQNVVALGAPGGSLAEYSTQVYQDVNSTLLAMYFDYTTPPAAGPEHLLFTLPDDIFVLPQAIQVVVAPPPSVSAVTPNGDGTVTIAGTGLTADSLIFFDSLPGTVKAPYDGNSVSVLPPPGANGQTATISVYNADGQNSTFVPPATPLTFTYPQTSAPAATISLGSLQQGATSMVKVTTSNMQFVQGQTTLGFGSGDVTVRRLWVVSPNEAWANVTVSDTALLRSTVASVISGFQVYEQRQGFQVTSSNGSLPVIGLPVTNAFYPLQNSLFPGAIGSIYGSNLDASSGTITLMLAGQKVPILYTSPTQINFVVPAGQQVGPAVLFLNNGTMSAHPVVVEIDPPPPVIVNVTGPAGATVDATQPVTPGDTVTLTLARMDPAAVSAPSRVGLYEAGVSIPAFTIQQARDGSGNLIIQFALAASVSGPQVPLTVSLDGDLGLPYYITVSPAPASDLKRKIPGV